MAKFYLQKKDDETLEHKAVKFSQYRRSQQNIFYVDTTKTDNENTHYQLILDEKQLVQALFNKQNIQSMPRSSFETFKGSKTIIKGEYGQFIVPNDQTGLFSSFIDLNTPNVKANTLCFVRQILGENVPSFTYEELTDAESFQRARNENVTIYAINADVFYSLNRIVFKDRKPTIDLTIPKNTGYTSPIKGLFKTTATKSPSTMFSMTNESSSTKTPTQNRGMASKFMKFFCCCEPSETQKALKAKLLDDGTELSRSRHKTYSSLSSSDSFPG